MSELPSAETMRAYASILRKPSVEIKIDANGLPHRFEHPAGEIAEAAATALEIVADMNAGLK